MSFVDLEKNKEFFVVTAHIITLQHAQCLSRPLVNRARCTAVLVSFNEPIVVDDSEVNAVESLGFMLTP